MNTSWLVWWWMAMSLIVVSCVCGAEDAKKRHRLDDFRGHMHHVQYDRHNATHPAVTEHNYTEALLDHFAPVSEARYWNQRYFVNDEFWAGDGFPVLLYIGGEGPLSPAVLTKQNYIHHLARRHRALLIAVEHRFYGRSYPVPDMSLPNMRYLTSAQGLSDLARIHGHLTMQHWISVRTWMSWGMDYGILVAVLVSARWKPS